MARLLLLPDSASMERVERPERPEGHRRALRLTFREDGGDEVHVEVCECQAAEVAAFLEAAAKVLRECSACEDRINGYVR